MVLHSHQHAYVTEGSPCLGYQDHLGVEQLFKIFNLCGSPPDDYWRKMKLSAMFRTPKAYKPTMTERCRDLPPSALSLLTTLLALDPAACGTAVQALQKNVVAVKGVHRRRVDARWRRR
ncbi:hypothetical protein EJB05_14614, partial [Eragrostis curvula]